MLIVTHTHEIKFGSTRTSRHSTRQHFRSSEVFQFYVKLGLTSVNTKGGRIPTASRQASRHEKKDTVLLRSWFRLESAHRSSTSASWPRPVWGGFHNLIRFNCAPFFESCRRHRVLTVTCLDACRCAAYLRYKSRYQVCSRWNTMWTQYRYNKCFLLNEMW
jgi:hypothetical protein